MPRPSRREHLVKTALRLFSRDGFHATGIDKLLREAGVSKKTLYAHFRSKDELILAVLTYYDSQFRNDFVRSVERAATTPRARLLAVFDVAEKWFSSSSFSGCLFIKAIGEHSDEDSPIRSVSRQFKRLMRNFLVDLSQQAGLVKPEALADQLSLILEGAIVTAHVSGSSSAAHDAKRAARVLIRAAS